MKTQILVIVILSAFAIGCASKPALRIAYEPRDIKLVTEDIPLIETPIGQMKRHSTIGFGGWEVSDTVTSIGVREIRADCVGQTINIPYGSFNEPRICIIRRVDGDGTVKPLQVFVNFKFAYRTGKMGLRYTNEQDRKWESVTLPVNASYAGGYGTVTLDSGVMHSIIFYLVNADKLQASHEALVPTGNGVKPMIETNEFMTKGFTDVLKAFPELWPNNTEALDTYGSKWRNVVKDSMLAKRDAAIAEGKPKYADYKVVLPHEPGFRTGPERRAEWRAEQPWYDDYLDIYANIVHLDKCTHVTEFPHDIEMRAQKLAIIKYYAPIYENPKKCPLELRSRAITDDIIKYWMSEPWEPLYWMNGKTEEDRDKLEIYNKRIAKAKREEGKKFRAERDASEEYRRHVYEIDYTHWRKDHPTKFWLKYMFYNPETAQGHIFLGLRLNPEIQKEHTIFGFIPWN